MGPRSIAALAALTVFGLSLSACGAEEQGSAAEEGARTQSASSSIPSPSEAQEAVLIRKLGQVDSGLAIPDSVDNARNTCTSILAGVGSADLVEATETRFNGDGIEAMTDDQAKQVIETIRSSEWCR